MHQKQDVITDLGENMYKNNIYIIYYLYNQK